MRISSIEIIIGIIIYDAAILLGIAYFGFIVLNLWFLLLSFFCLDVACYIVAYLIFVRKRKIGKLIDDWERENFD